MSVEIPAIRPQLAVRAIGADLMLAIDDVTVRPLAGRLFPLLLPLIDGCRSRFDIADALDGRATLLDVDFGLQELVREGVVYDRAAPPGEARQPSPEQTAAAPLEPLSAAVVVAGDMDMATVDAFIAGARAGGIRVVSEHRPGDLRIVLTTDYFAQHLRDLNSGAFASGAPWMIVKPMGAVPWIGPLFDRQRHAPCWNCLLLRLRETFRLEEYLRVHAPEVGLPKVAPLPSARAARASGQIAADMARRWRSAGPLERPVAALIALDLDSAAVSEHGVARRPDCIICGQDRVVAQRFVSTAIGPDGRGGQQLSAELLGHVSPITGIVGSIESARSPGAPAYVAVADHIFGPEIDNRDSIWRRFRRSTSGAGASDAEARRNAICEALERYSGVFRHGDSSCRATLRELGETAIHPNDVMGFSAAQFAGRQAWNDQHSHPAVRIPESFDPDLACDWTAIRHIASAELAWLPTALCYFGTPDSEARRACRAESNGCAAGATRDDALVRGFLELVERDAVGLWWHNRIPRPGIALDTIPDGYVRSVVNLYERLGRSLWILEIQSDLAIPVFAAISARAGTVDEQLTIGFGASFERSAALRHAVTELNLFLPEVAAGRRRALVCGPEPAGDYLHPTSLLPWSAGARDSSRRAEAGPGREFDWIIHVARQHGLRVFALDQTRADVGLPTVRVIVPGLCHFWRRLAPRRLYAVPVRMGWLSAPRREDDLNPSCLLV